MVITSFPSFLRCSTARALFCPTSTRAQTRCTGRRVWRSRLKVMWSLQTRGTTALKCIATCSSAPAFLLPLACCFARSAPIKPLNQTREDEQEAPEHSSFTVKFSKYTFFFLRPCDCSEWIRERDLISTQCIVIQL